MNVCGNWLLSAPAADLHQVECRVADGPKGVELRLVRRLSQPGQARESGMDRVLRQRRATQNVPGREQERSPMLPIQVVQPNLIWHTTVPWLPTDTTPQSPKLCTSRRRFS